MLAAVRCRGRVHRGRLDVRGPQRAPYRALGVERAEVGPFRLSHARSAVPHRLVQRILAHGDGGHMEHRIDMRRPVVAEELAVGSFDFAETEFVEVTLDDHLGIRRRRDAVRDAANHRHGLAAQRGDETEFLDRNPQTGSQIVQRV